MRVAIDRDRCVGAGQCVMTAPDVFDQGDDGLSVLLQAHPPEHLADDVDLAAQLCPAQAITVQPD